jgi:hypothetical protein
MKNCEVFLNNEGFRIISLEKVNDLHIYSKKVVFMPKNCTAKELGAAINDCLSEAGSSIKRKIDFKRHMKNVVNLLKTPSLELLYKNSRNCIVQQTGKIFSIEKREWMSRYGHLPVEKIKLHKAESIGDSILKLLV